MSVRYLGVCSAPAGSYIVLIHETNYALVLPVVGWVSKVFTRADVSEYLIVDPLISDSTGEGMQGGPEHVDLYIDWEWKTFAPGENGLRWVEAWYEAQVPLPLSSLPVRSRTERTNEANERTNGGDTATWGAS